MATATGVLETGVLETISGYCSRCGGDNMWRSE